MKVVMFSQAREISDQPDYDISFRRATSAGERIDFLNVPFIGYADKHGWNAFYRRVLEVNEDFHPDMVFFQFYHSGGDEGIAECCRSLRIARNRPLIFGSIGDPFYTGWASHFARPLPKSAVNLAANADAFFATAMGNVAEELVRKGGKNIVFLPNAFCPEHFPYWEDPYLEDREFDVVMLCSKGRLLGRKIVANYCNNWHRRYVVSKMARYFGKRFSVFGRGWTNSSAVGTIPFKEQVRIYRKSKVVLDAPAPIIHTNYYSSDRAFFMLGSGSALVHFHTPRFETMVRQDENVYFVHRLRDVCSVCEKVLALPEDVLNARRTATRELVKERHLISHRVDTIISTAEALLKHRNGELTLEAALRHLRLWHFLPEVDLESEYKYAVLNWVG